MAIATSDHRLPIAAMIALAIPFALATALAQGPATAPLSAATRSEAEAFLSTAGVVGDAGPPSAAAASWRVTLDDGKRRHAAGVESADGSDPTRRHYRFNVAAYELDKLLELNLVLPSVERVMGGRPAAVTWWLDDFAMAELDRRRKRIEPPDRDRWDKHVQAVRVFDELISNTYRDPSPALYLNTVWDNLLITRDWTIWLTDHTGAFRTRTRLEDPDSLVRCDRALLGRLRSLNRRAMERTLGAYLSVEQVDALEVRRRLLVKHFDEQMAVRGEAAVLYDRAPRP